MIWSCTVCVDSPCITNKGPKKLMDFGYYAVLTHSAKFWRLVLQFFGNITCFRTLFEGFWRCSFDFWGYICPFSILYYQVRTKKQPDFKYWAILTCSAQFWGLISPFFGNKACLMTLFGGLGMTFRFLERYLPIIDMFFYKYMRKIAHF